MYETGHGGICFECDRCSEEHPEGIEFIANGHRIYVCSIDCMASALIRCEMEGSISPDEFPEMRDIISKSQYSSGWRPPWLDVMPRIMAQIEQHGKEAVAKYWGEVELFPLVPMVPEVYIICGNCA